YSITEQLQFAVGGNNIFSIRPDTVSSVGSIASSGATQMAGGGNVIGAPVGAAFDPNGGYYYGRITFNF
ncbi:MAG: hypothetical protein ACXWLJ_06405, partial [Rhizomicrobium sp.]